MWKELKIKEWFYEKTEATSRRYNTYIDVNMTEDHKLEVIDGYVTVYVREEIAESEKAIQVVLSTGSVVGSYKGWKTWIPKSVIA